MGSGHSVRATHFQHPRQTEAEIAPDDIPDEDHHISISNKMVERLVEDATLAGGAAAVRSKPAPLGDYKDKIYMEKLKTLDDNHSERTGLTLEDLNSTATRIELRTANMISPEPICAECKQKVIDCYSEQPENIVKCSNTVAEFTRCVQDAAATRLRARTEREARELALRSRHVAHAREHALRDLGPPRDASA